MEILGASFVLDEQRIQFIDEYTNLYWYFNEAEATLLLFYLPLAPLEGILK